MGVKEGTEPGVVLLQSGRIARRPTGFAVGVRPSAKPQDGGQPLTRHPQNIFTPCRGQGVQPVALSRVSRQRAGAERAPMGKKDKLRGAASTRRSFALGGRSSERDGPV